LFKICGLLIDKNLEIVGEIIIENIKYNDVNIDDKNVLNKIQPIYFELIYYTFFWKNF